MSLTDRMRALAEVADPAGSVTVTVRWILEQLHDAGPSPAAFEPLADLDVRQVAELMGRGASTVRGWLHSGDLEGYRLNGREWRVKREALRAFQDKQAAPNAKPAQNARPQQAAEGDCDTNGWRRHYRKGHK